MRVKTTRRRVLALALCVLLLLSLCSLSALAQEPETAPEEIRSVLFVHRQAEQFAERFLSLFYSEGDVIDPRVPEEMFAAEGYHWVRFGSFDDWAKTQIATKNWRNAGQ